MAILPEQIVGLDTNAIATVGVGFTVISVVASFPLKHPSILVPVILYV